MQTLLFGVFDFVAKHKWVQLVLIGLLIVFTLGMYLMWRDGNVRKRVKLEQEVETAREQARVDQTRREIAQENQDASIRADEAVAALPRINDTRELREHSEAIATELLGPDQRSVR